MKKKNALLIAEFARERESPLLARRQTGKSCSISVHYQSWHLRILSGEKGYIPGARVGKKFPLPRRIRRGIHLRDTFPCKLLPLHSHTEISHWQSFHSYTLFRIVYPIRCHDDSLAKIKRIRCKGPITVHLICDKFCHLLETAHSFTKRQSGYGLPPSNSRNMF